MDEELGPNGKQIFHAVVGLLIFAGAACSLITLIPTSFVVWLFSIVVAALLVGGILYEVLSLARERQKRHGSRQKTP